MWRKCISALRNLGSCIKLLFLIVGFNIKRNKKIYNFNVRASNYAHAVHFNLPAKYKLSDEYFDLLPGD